MIKAPQEIEEGYANFDGDEGDEVRDPEDDEDGGERLEDVVGAAVEEKLRTP